MLAVTGVVLAIRPLLRSDATPARTTPAVKARPAGVGHHPKPARAKRWYLIQSGDTLGAIASQRGTSVAALLRLNPGVEPTALRPGERLQVP